MFVYGKMAANAIAVMSYLAASLGRKAGSGEIASVRKLSPTLTAKLLTQLAAAGLVKGQPGPGGGYSLAQKAKEISLLDIASVFEQTETPSVCPFGEGWCGNGEPCPLHNKIQGILRHRERYIQNTRLSVFMKKRGSAPEELTALQKRSAGTKK
ncbi:MAG TPA: Rrf2 family transcriptional regulator [Candidatus Kapabacteria bacterium]|nr:Rrf2 family transcriptional regulator [Candidatus Kapabacteria bacterium]